MLIVLEAYNSKLLALMVNDLLNVFTQGNCAVAIQGKEYILKYSKQ